MARVLVGLRKQFINHFIFPTRACAAGFNKNNNYDYYSVFQKINDFSDFNNVVILSHSQITLQCARIIRGNLYYNKKEAMFTVCL